MTAPNPIPPWMPQPTDPPTDAPYHDGAKITAQRVDSHGDVIVTWALPGFQTAHVRMPYAAWVEGWAYLLAPHLSRLVSPLDETVDAE